MKLIGISLGLFLLSVFFLGAITLFESLLLGTPMNVERAITFFLLVLPTGCGAVLAAVSLVRKEGQVWPAVTLLALNALFALFHLAVTLFAG